MTGICDVIAISKLHPNSSAKKEQTRVGDSGELDGVSYGSDMEAS
jgi:hypothetical protein